MQCRHAAALAVPHADAPGVSRFTLLYLVYAHVLLLCAPAAAAAAAAGYVPPRALVKRSLVCFDGSDVMRYSMSELRLAYDVLRQALDCGNWLPDEHVVRYVRALELRGAQLLLGAGGAGDDDEPEWCDEHGGNEACAETLAWWGAHVRRAVSDALDVASPRALATCARGDARCVRAAAPDAAARAAVLARLRALARRASTEDDRRDLARVCAPYDTLLGDADVHSALYPLTGRATVRDVVTRERTPDAASYAVFVKYVERPLHEWLDAFDGGGGDECDHERLQSALCALHLVDRYFVGRHKLPWASWYLALLRAADYGARVRRAAVNGGVPYVVQRMGARFACVVPLHAAPRRGGAPPRMRVYARARGWLRDDDGGVPPPSLLVLECRDALDALTLWFECTLHGAGGLVCGHERMARALSTWLVATTDGAAAEQAAAADDTTPPRTRKRARAT